MMIVSPHQSLITQPGLIPNRDGPEIISEKKRVRINTRTYR